MYQRKSRRCCAAMLAVSVCLRVCMLLGLDARAAAWMSAQAAQPGFVQRMLFLETGQAVRTEITEEAPSLWVLRVEHQPAEGAAPVEEGASAEEPVDEPGPAAVAAPLLLAGADEIPIVGGCTYSYDKAALLARPSALELSGSGPQILIVHTHGSEAYTPEPGWEYDSLGNYRTLDAERSVIAVGQALADTLEDCGFSVIHDTAVNDYPSYNDSYWTTLGRIEQWQQQYPSLQMVIDVHRDAVEDSAGQALALSAQSGGESCARLMLVVGTDQGGLEHPNWQENLANALKLQSVLEGSYPGLCRSLDLRTERFNQHATPGSILVEVGSNGNTLEQALRSAQILGNALAQMLLLLQQNGGVLTADGSS